MYEKLLYYSYNCNIPNKGEELIKNGIYIHWFYINIVNVLVVIDYKGGYSLIGKTAILHIVISGSSPDNSNIVYIYILCIYYLNISSRSSIGRAEHWRCLGCKFKSYLGHYIIYGCAEIW